MFDARSILDVLVRGGGQPQGAGPQGGADIFRDLLGQLAGQADQPTSHRQAPAQGRPAAEDDQSFDAPRPRGRVAEAPGSFDDMRPTRPASSGQAEDATPGQPGGLEDLLRSVLGGGQGGGNLQDMLRDLLGGPGSPQGGSQGGPMSRMVDQGGQGQGGPAQGGPGALLDVLRQVLGQATEGVREGAGRLDEATGASTRAREAIGQATGQSPDQIVARIRELISNNQLGAGAALGGLGALILGTGAGRSLAGSAIKLGGLALIGGLAYKAYQNYQQGLPPLGGGRSQAQPLVAAPEGSGFEPAAVTHDQAVLLIRAMIAAAAADGRIDEKEQQKILGGLQQAGLDGAARQFLTNEINNPATVDDLAASVTSQAEAVQVYTAARVAIDVDLGAEHEFLQQLAQALGIDADLAAQVDAAARRPG